MTLHRVAHGRPVCACICHDQRASARREPQTTAQTHQALIGIRPGQGLFIGLGQNWVRTGVAEPTTLQTCDRNALSCANASCWQLCACIWRTRLRCASRPSLEGHFIQPSGPVVPPAPACLESSHSPVQSERRLLSHRWQEPDYCRHRSGRNNRPSPGTLDAPLIRLVSGRQTLPSRIYQPGFAALCRHATILRNLRKTIGQMR